MFDDIGYAEEEFGEALAKLPYCETAWPVHRRPHKTLAEKIKLMWAPKNDHELIDFHEIFRNFV